MVKTVEHVGEQPGSVSSNQGRRGYCDVMKSIAKVKIDMSSLYCEIARERRASQAVNTTPHGHEASTKRDALQGVQNYIL